MPGINTNPKEADILYISFRKAAIDSEEAEEEARLEYGSAGVKA